jgi:hypothetical protein
MPIQTVLHVCAIVYVVIIGLELAFKRRVRRFLLELLILAALVILAALITNAVTGYIAFGAGTSSTSVVIIMLVGVVLGVAARYLFYLRGAFSWSEFLKPLCISPIVLLPLIGSVQAVKSLETMQVISFGLLAFQNGFFWQVVLERARPQ